MIFRDSQIPEEFNHLAQTSDNYLVWVRETKLSSGTNYNAYIQYLTPSWLVVFTDKYKIRDGTSYSFDYNYVTGSYGGSYIDSADYRFALDTIPVSTDNFTDDLHYRADFPQIFGCGFILCFVFWWVFHNLSKLFLKGGV